MGSRNKKKKDPTHHKMCNFLICPNKGFISIFLSLSLADSAYTNAGSGGRLTRLQNAQTALIHTNYASQTERRHHLLVIRLAGVLIPPRFLSPLRVKFISPSPRHLGLSARRKHSLIIMNSWTCRNLGEILNIQPFFFCFLSANCSARGLALLFF